MKKYLLIAATCLLFSLAEAQNANYKVVFDLTSRDSVNQQTVIREMMLIREANPDAKMQVVVYGQGIDLVLKGKSTQQPAIQKLLVDQNIAFKVCAVTMKRNNIDKSMLIPGVQVVPDGIYEIVSKQQEGWGYIKVAH